MMASPPLTIEIADALERVTAVGNRRNRTSREWAESEVEYCEALAALRALFGYGDWLPFVAERGWSYDDVSRCLRFHKLGGTAELLMEHRMTGALALLSEQHRAARREAEPTPQPGPEPASEDDGEFCSTSKFDPPPETPPGAGDAPFSPAAHAPIHRNLFWGVRTVQALRPSFASVLRAVIRIRRTLRARETDSRAERGYKAPACPSKRLASALFGVGRDYRAVREIGGLAGANAADQAGQGLVCGAGQVERGTLCSPPGWIREGTFRE